MSNKYPNEFKKTRKEILAELKTYNTGKTIDEISNNVGLAKAYANKALRILCSNGDYVFRTLSVNDDLYNYMTEINGIPSEIRYFDDSLFDTDFSEITTHSLDYSGTLTKNETLVYLRHILDLYLNIIWYKERYEQITEAKMDIYSASYSHAVKSNKNRGGITK